MSSFQGSAQSAVDLFHHQLKLLLSLLFVLLWQGGLRLWQRGLRLCLQLLLFSLWLLYLACQLLLAL
jgi:hypothetical protein